jgi:hypothetical protein
MNINVSSQVSGKYSEIGVASPVITHSIEGEKYKFY